jgi:hypothetical protein
VIAESLVTLLSASASAPRRSIYSPTRLRSTVSLARVQSSVMGRGSPKLPLPGLTALTQPSAQCNRVVDSWRTPACGSVRLSCHGSMSVSGAKGVERRRHSSRSTCTSQLQHRLRTVEREALQQRRNVDDANGRRSLGRGAHLLASCSISVARAQTANEVETGTFGSCHAWGRRMRVRPARGTPRVRRA